MRGAAGLLATAAAVMCQPRVSAACSPPPCGPGYFVPATGSTVPANLPALYWQSQSSFVNGAPPADPALVTLTTTADPTTPLSLTTTLVRSSSFQSHWLLAPAQPLVEGVSYTATDTNECHTSFNRPPKSTFSAGPASPLPTALGALTRAPTEIGELELWTISGSCTSPAVVASARIQLELSADALPWRDALHFETLVDGQPWTDGDFDASGRPPGSNGQGRGLDLVYRLCHSDDPYVAMGVGPGAHAVTMRATLPGTSLMLVTPAISIALECPPPPIDADVTDVTPGPEQTGCGCATSGTSSRATLLLALATFAVATRRRSRRRS